MADYNLWKRDQMHSQKHRFIKTPYGYGYYTSGLEAYDQLDSEDKGLLKWRAKPPMTQG